MAFTQVQIKKQFLAGSGCSLSDTSIILRSFELVDNTGAVTPVTMSMFGDIGYATLEPGTSKEEQISWTGITQNADGTATLTGVTRGIDFVTPYAADNDLRYSHAGGTELVVSNTAKFYTQFMNTGNAATITGLFTFSTLPVSSVAPTLDTHLTNKLYVDTLDDANVKLTGTQTVAGVKTFSSLPTIPETPSAATDAASKGYVDSVAIAGAPNASTTVKGIVQEATQSEVDAGTAVGSTGARLFMNPSTLPSIYGVFGPGTDGVVDFDGVNTFSFASLVGSTYTLTRDIVAKSIEIQSGITLKNGGYRIYSCVELVNAGTIDNSGTAGGNAVTGGAAAAAGVGGAAGTLAGGKAGQLGATGGNGQGGVSGTAATNTLNTPAVTGAAGGNGGFSGTGGSGGAAGTTENLRMVVGDSVSTISSGETTTWLPYILPVGSTTGRTLSTQAGAGSGACGQFSSTTGGNGGGSGGGGGIIFIASPSITNTGSILTIGGNGGTGSNATGGGGAGGGGAAGSGGVIILAYVSLTDSGTMSVAGGTGGAPGTGGGSPTAGGNGNAGVIYKLNIA